MSSSSSHRQQPHKRQRSEQDPASDEDTGGDDEGLLLQDSPPGSPRSTPSSSSGGGLLSQSQRAALLANRAAQRRRLRNAESAAKSGGGRRRGGGGSSPVRLEGDRMNDDDNDNDYIDDDDDNGDDGDDGDDDFDGTTIRGRGRAGPHRRRGRGGARRRGRREGEGDDPDEDDVDDNEEEEDGEDLMENMERDYQRIEALDTYGTEGLDDREYDPLDRDARVAAERELDRRDRRNDGFYGAMLDALEAEEDDEARQARRGAFGGRGGGDGGDGDGGSDDGDDVTDEEDLDGDDQVNLEAFDVPLREWIAQHRTRREIQRKFRAFLRHFTGEPVDQQSQRRRRGNGMYEQKIRAMCASNLSTLQVSYLHLMEAEPVLAYWLVDAPKDMVGVLNEAATRHTLMLFPSYHAIKSEIHVRISDVPVVDSLRDLRRSHLDCLVKVHGVVTRRSAVYPQLQLAYYACAGCKQVQGPFRIEGVGSALAEAHAPDTCPNERCGASHFRLHPTLSQYRNVQRLNLQETPGSVPPGRVPRTKEILLADDLIDVARPGEEVEVTGVFEHTFDTSLTLKSGFPVFSTFIHANHVAKREDASSASNLSESDVRKILDLARDPKIGRRIVQSIAPSIHGHESCKMALALALFGGVPKNVNDKHRIRGDVNVLLLGDPGTAKSQLLKYAELTAPRAVYTTGKGASAVGLTASVHKDPITREWTLEGGALVLGDRGVVCVDEFDKMNEQDRTSIHEAMEQQSISISKAGIVTSLQARCSVIAAANPIGGRYDSANTLADNVELTDPILQRFDILCVLQDIVDPVADERLAKFVTSSHMRSVPTSTLATGELPPATSEEDRPGGLIPQDLLRKYIQYARTHVKPILRDATFDQEKVASLYVALRRESSASGGVPIAVRHIESLMRMSEAHAKMHLRDYVRDDDMDASIQMMLESFIGAQKFCVRRSLRRSFAKFITSGDDRAQLLLHMLQDMFRKEQMYQVIRLRQKNQSEALLDALQVPVDELEGRARERRIYDIAEFCRSALFQEAGYVYDERRRVIVRKV